MRFPIHFTLLALSTLASAQVTTFTSPTTWGAASTATTFVDFEGLAPNFSFINVSAPPGVTRNGVNFSINRTESNGAMFVQGKGAPYPASSVLSSQQSTATNNNTLITLPTGYTSIGFNVSTDVSPLTLRLSTGETYTLTLPLYPQLSFFGVTSTRAISSLQISGRGGVDIIGFAFGAAAAGSTVPCAYSLSAGSASFTAAAGAGIVNITTAAGCAWSVLSETVPSWVSITSGASGIGNGAINYSVAANAGGYSRPATLTIAGQRYLIQQAGGACSYSLPQASQSFVATGGSGLAAITAPSGCAWTAISQASWIRVTSGASGTASGTANFVVDPNTTSTARVGSITIGGRSFQVSQAGIPASATCLASAVNLTFVAAEGLAEPLGDLTVTCSGLTAATTVDVSLATNANITNRVSGSTTDATLSINAGTPSPGALPSPNQLSWTGVTLPAGTSVLSIRNVRANANSLGVSATLVATQIVGFLTLKVGGFTIPVTNSQQTLAYSQPGSVFLPRTASALSFGQTTVPMHFQEASPAAYKVASGTASGTRLRIGITNIPATVKVFVSVYPSQGADKARLYSADSNGVGGSPVTGVAAAGGIYQELAPTSGSATATWEVLQADPDVSEPLDFTLLLQNSTAADLAALSVAGGMAPLSFATSADATSPVPRFADLSTARALTSGVSAPPPVFNLRLKLEASAPAVLSKAEGPRSAATAQPQAGEYLPGSSVGINLSLVNEATNGETVPSAVVQNNLPPGFSFLNCTVPSGSGASCNAIGGSVIVAFANLLPGPSPVVTVNGVLPSASAGSENLVLTNTAFGNISVPDAVNTQSSAMVAGVTFVIANSSTAKLTSPLAGAALQPTTNFTWDAVSGATAYWLDIGTSQGKGDLCASGSLTALSFSCNRILTSPGATIYVQLFTYQGGAWQAPERYTFLTPAFAVITSPVPGTPLAASATFSWAVAAGADGYWLDIGTAPGSGNICASGVLTAATVNFTCSGITAGGASVIYAQLFTRIGGVWQPPTKVSYNSLAAAALTSPAAGATISSSTVTFNWTAGAGVDAYWLDVGTALGQGNVSSGSLTGTSKTVTGVPTGGILYVRLWSRNASNGQWLTPPADYTFSTATDVRAKLTAPTATTLTGANITFTWSAGTGADSYWLDVGPTAGSGAYSSGQLTALSKTVTGLPCTGAPVFVRLWTRIAGAWQSPIDYPFTQASSCSSVATLTSPAAGAAITGNSATFTWTSAVGASQYWLDVGSSAGSGNISGGATIGTNRTVNTLPGDGKPLYVRLWTNIGGTWQTPIDYVFSTSADHRATLISPAPGTRITGASATFTWTAGGAGVDAYWLDVGTALGSGNLSSGQQTATTKTVSALPNAGGTTTVYVRLWTRIAGAWQTPIDYTFSN